MERLGFALIGCGGMGRTAARVLAQIPRAQLVAVCDAQEQAARSFGEEMGVPAYTQAAAMLAQPEVGAVIVATPNSLHTALVLDAAAAGKHIFCEKPMALTVAECDAMIAAATHHGVRLMVGHVLRLLPLFSRVIDIVDSGLLGHPVAAQILRLSWLGDPAARYRLRRATAGGQLYDITVHEIDLLHRLCGPTTSVYATMGRAILQDIDYEDTVQLHLSFGSGATAHIFESIASPTERAEGLLLATQGALRYDWRAGQLAYRRAGDTQETVETVTRADGEDGYLRELRSFTAWVLDGTPPLLTAHEGRAAIAVVEAAYRSAQSGQPVAVPPSTGGGAPFQG